MCCSVVDINRKQLQDLRSVQGTLLRGLDTSLNRVMQSIHTYDGLNMQRKRHMIYRLIHDVHMSSVLDDWESKFHLLPSLLEEISLQNPSSHVCLQLDTKGRFNRLFLSLPNITMYQDLWMPVLQSDGTHMKHRLYNGICYLIIGHDDNGKNIFIVICFLPKETTEHLVWFFANCALCGLDLDEVAVFVDRGKALYAHKILHHMGLEINLKFCSWHIGNNVKLNFGGKDEDICVAISSLQQCLDGESYKQNLIDIHAKFPPKNSNEPFKCIAEYLASIHPMNWTVFGNSILTPQETHFINSTWPTKELFGAPIKLFGVKTTSANEGENNAYILNNLRDSHPFDAIILFLERSVATFENKRLNGRSWTSSQYNLVSFAKAVTDDQMLLHQAYQIDVVDFDSRIFRVKQMQNSLCINTLSLTEYTVDLDHKTCTRCPTHAQLPIPC